jgi:hypothetical protein
MQPPPAGPGTAAAARQSRFFALRRAGWPGHRRWLLLRRRRRTGMARDSDGGILVTVQVTVLVLPVRPVVLPVPRCVGFRSSESHVIEVHRRTGSRATTDSEGLRCGRAASGCSTGTRRRAAGPIRVEPPPARRRPGPGGRLGSECPSPRTRLPPSSESARLRVSSGTVTRGRVRRAVLGPARVRRRPGRSRAQAFQHSTATALHINGYYFSHVRVSQLGPWEPGA